MLDRTPAALIPLLGAALLGACGGPGPGESALREGRFADAARETAEAERAAGESAPPELSWNRALALLGTGDLDGAEAAAGRAAARGGERFEGLRDLLRGSAAWARCDAAESESLRTGRDTAAFDRAIALAEAAGEAWRAAATGREDRPEARRNAERALLRARRLRNDRAAADREKGRAPGEAAGVPSGAPAEGEAPPGEGEGPRPPGEGAEEAPGPVAGEGARDLPRGEVLRLLERLADMEKEKEALRRARREARGGGVERDW